MPCKISYEFDIKKVAMVHTSKGSLQVGTIEQYFDNNGQVKVTVHFNDKLPKEVIDQISKDPQVLSIVGEPSNLRNVKLTDQPFIHLPR